MKKYISIGEEIKNFIVIDYILEEDNKTTTEVSFKNLGLDEQEGKILAYRVDKHLNQIHNAIMNKSDDFSKLNEENENLLFTLNYDNELVYISRDLINVLGEYFLKHDYCLIEKDYYYNENNKSLQFVLQEIPF